ncbi:cyclin-T1 isoform X2 [Emydura macquarii macquarii]
MISRNNSDMNIAGLMSMSTSSTAGAGPLLPAAEDCPGDLSDMDMLQSEHWMSHHPPHKLEVGQVHRTNESSVAPDLPLAQDGAAYQKQSSKSVPSAKVSLKEYRAKHAEELAAQKRQLENMEANVRSQYAYAAQNLLVQQQREREVQQENNPSPIILKIPAGSSDSAERPLEKIDKASTLKLRIPVAGGGGDRPLSSKPEEIKMRIKVPTASDRHSSSDESSGKSREHKEKHKGHLSNHHHHNHSHKHLHAQPAAAASSAGGKRPGDLKHSGQPSTLAHKSYSLSGASRKRPLLEEASAAAHEHQPKVSKSAKAAGMQFFSHLPGAAPLPGHSLDAASLPFPQAGKARGSHGKSDKGPTGANGHSTNQAIDYQDTVNMLHSLLSAQGMQPTQPPAFDFAHSYGEYLNPRATGSSRAANTDKPRPPPLPSEPPPPLPPLPK